MEKVPKVTAITTRQAMKRRREYFLVEDRMLFSCKRKARSLKSWVSEREKFLITSYLLLEKS